MCGKYETNAGTYLRHAAKYDRSAIKDNYEGRDEKNNNNNKKKNKNCRTVNPTNRLVVRRICSRRI